MRDEPVDLSALEPSRARWEAMIEATVLASLQPVSVWLLVGQMRVGVLALVVLAVLAWVPSLFHVEEAAPVRAQAVVTYAHGGDLTAMLEASDAE